MWAGWMKGRKERRKKGEMEGIKKRRKKKGKGERKEPAFKICPNWQPLQ